MEEAKDIAERIAKTGVWRQEGEDPVKFWTMFIFRDGLQMVQGQAE